jgi:hypothetical protein
MFMRKVRDQLGVAMVTVLFVGAVLTVVGSSATFIAIRELRASTDDRSASEALAYAEAGVDRLLQELRRGSLTWGHLREAGCGFPPLTLPTTGIGNGTYSATLTVYDRNTKTAPASPWTIANDSVAPCLNRPTSPKEPAFYAITVRGSHPTGARVVRQVVKIEALDLPVGIYADSVVANGNPDLKGISLITPGDVIGREKLGFTGCDPYYTLNDFWPGQSTTQCVPTSVHALGEIYYKKEGTQREHPPALNCDANDKRGTKGQSQFDESTGGSTINNGPPCTGQTLARPPDSKFTPADMARVAPRTNLQDQDYLTLKEAARASGIYCFFPTSGGSQCTKAGVATGGYGSTAGLPNNFVAYFEFQDASKAMTSNNINWGNTWWGCNTDPMLSKSVVIVVRNGSVHINANTMTNGAMFIPEGEFNDNGGHVFNGTIIARVFDSTGNPQKQLDTCWVNNLPGPFLSVVPDSWSELDRSF